MSDTAEDLPEAAVDPTTRDILLWTRKILYWIIYPIAIAIYYLFFYISFALVFLLKLLYEPLAFVLLPIFYLLQFVWACFLAPFQFIAKFETIYIYLGIAALIGLTSGFILSFIYSALKGPLNLNSQPVEAGRTVKQYRKEKRKQKKARGGEPSLLLSEGYSSPNLVSLSDGMRKGGRGKGKGLVSQTIMEELDSDY